MLIKLKNVQNNYVFSLCNQSKNLLKQQEENFQVSIIIKSLRYYYKKCIDYYDL